MNKIVSLDNVIASKDNAGQKVFWFYNLWIKKKKVISEQFACSDAKSVMKSYQENGRFSLKGKQFFREPSNSQFVMRCNT